MMQKLRELQGERKKSTIIVKLNIHFSVTDKLSRQKSGKDTIYLNSTINKLNLFDVYKIFHPTTEYTFFLKSNRTFTKIDHSLSHKTTLTKFKQIEIIQRMLSDHTEIKGKISNRKIAGKCPNIWNLTYFNTWGEKAISRLKNILS